MNILKLLKRATDKIKARLTSPKEKDAREKRLQEVKYLLMEEVRTQLNTPLPANWKRTPFGRPPYRRTGNLYSRVYGKVFRGAIYLTANAKSKKGFNYGLYHEEYNPKHRMSGRHPFIRPAVSRIRAKLASIKGYKRIPIFIFGKKV